MRVFKFMIDYRTFPLKIIMHKSDLGLMVWICSKIAFWLKLTTCYYIYNHVNCSISIFSTTTVLECKRLDPPPNGHSIGTCDNIYDSRCQFDCDSDYEMVGDNTLHCQSNDSLSSCLGIWEGQYPMCRCKLCNIQFPSFPLQNEMICHSAIWFLILVWIAILVEPLRSILAVWKGNEVHI